MKDIADLSTHAVGARLLFRAPAQVDDLSEQLTSDTADSIEAEAVARFEEALSEYRALTLPAEKKNWIGSAVAPVIALARVPFAFVRGIWGRPNGDE